MVSPQGPAHGAVSGYSMRRYLEQPPSEGNIFPALPHAEWETTNQMALTQPRASDHNSLSVRNPAEHGHADNKNKATSEAAAATDRHPGSDSGSSRRRQKCDKVKHLGGVGLLFDMVGLAIEEYDDEEYDEDEEEEEDDDEDDDEDDEEQEEEEDMPPQTQEMLDESLLGVGSRFPHKKHLRY